MGIQHILLNGGLDLVNSKQIASPGSLRDCLNFEVGIKQGYVETKGFKAYGTGRINDVINPWVIHWCASNIVKPNAGDIVGGVTGISWTDQIVLYWGGDPAIGVLNNSNYSGKGTICYSHQDGGQGLIGLTSIEGRFPVVGDILESRDFLSLLVPPSTFGFKSVTLIRPLYRASDVIRDGGVSFFNSTANTVDAVTNLITQFDVDALSQNSGTNDSPLTIGKGLFYFNARDSLYLVSDIERRQFSSEDAVYSVGDILRIEFATGLFLRRVIVAVQVTSGSFSGGDAAGFIDLVGDTTAEGTFNGVPLSVQNITTSAFSGNPDIGLVESKNAGLFKANVTSGMLWKLQDIGHEVRFIEGEVFPTVLNRLNKTAELEGAVTDTGWVPAGTAAGWSFASNATGVPDGAVAKQLNQPAGDQTALSCTNYGFSIPDRSVILGVQVRVKRRIEPGTQAPCSDKTVSLIGMVGSQNKAIGLSWPTVLTDQEYGAASDVWGTSLSASVVNSSGFGVSISAIMTAGGISTNREIDSVEIKVTYKDQSSVVYLGGPSNVSITLTSVGTTATATAPAGHGYRTGDSVTTTGAIQPAYNGTYVITVLSDTVFTYTFAGDTSTATGTIIAYRNFASARVIWYHKKTGDWGTSDAEGTMTLYNLTSPSGTPLVSSASIPSGVSIRTASGGAGTFIATTSSAPEKIFLPSSTDLASNDSQWEFYEGNFFSSEGTEQVFGVSGAGFAWSWDGTYLIRIRTGVEDARDKPAHVTKHLDQLLLGYRSGSVIASDAGYPESFAAIVGGTNGVSSPISDDVVTYPVFAGGAQEIPMGDAVYGLTPMSEQSVFVGCKDSRRQIVGSIGALIQAVIDPSIGIIEYTLKNLSRPIFTDYEGVKWIDGELVSYPVSPWLIPRIQEERASTTNSSGVLRAEVIRYKSQYRLFFRDKMILTITLNRGTLALAQNTGNQCTFQSLPFIPSTTTTGVTTGGAELIFVAPHGVAVGDDDLVPLYEADTTITPNPALYPPGFVYQMDVGSTWNGAMAIPRVIEINGSVGDDEWRDKHYDRMIVSGTCYGFAPFGANYSVNFNDIETVNPKNINAGKLSALGINAFSEQYFSVTEPVLRDGYALSVKFVADGDKLYGASSETQTSPYKFRPLTLQSILLITEDNRIRR